MTQCTCTCVNLFIGKKLFEVSSDCGLHLTYLKAIHGFYMNQSSVANVVRHLSTTFLINKGLHLSC